MSLMDYFFTSSIQCVTYSGMVPIPVQAMVSGRAVSVMTGSIMDDFMTAAPTMAMSQMDDFMTAGPTTIRDFESSVPTIMNDFANRKDFDFEDEDMTDINADENQYLVFETSSMSSSSSSSDSSEGYPATLFQQVNNVVDYVT